MIQPERSLVIQCIILLLVGLFQPLAAHNGAVAIAVPVKNITIDGDLSDWPAHLPTYAIELTEYGLSPSDTSDFQAHFRSGYNEETNSLFIAVEVVDESVVIDTASAIIWNASDGCEIYIDAGHDEPGSTPVQFYVYGDRTSLTKGETDAQVAWKRGANYHHYEWHIDLDALTRGRFLAQPNTTLGLDLVVADKDADSSYSWVAWGKGVAKTIGNERRGDIALALPGIQSGELNGHMERSGSGLDIARRRVYLRSTTHPRLLVNVETDATGNYAVSLLPGTYTVNLSSGSTAGDTVVVHSGERTSVNHSIAATKGHSQVAGKGRIVEAGTGVRQGMWQSLSVVDGLADNNVRAILQDRSGYLWMGTGVGLSRFDGRYLASLDSRDGLVSDEVRCLVQDGTGALWIGTDGGISRYDGQRFTNFTSADGLISNQVRAMAIDSSGMLWIGTDAGLVRYDGWEFVAYTQAEGLPGSQVRSLMVGADGNLWMGIWGRGLTRYDGEHFTSFTAEDGLADNQVRPVLQARDGSIWIGTETGLSKYDGQIFTHYTVSPEATYEQVQALYEDRQGRIWVGTWGGGISRFDGKKFVNYTTLDGLASDIVWGFAEDREGVLWIGSLGGVTRFDERITNFTTADGLAHNYVRAIVQDKRGDLWFGAGFGTLGGVARYDGKEFTRYHAVDGIAHNEVWSLIEDRQNNMWVGTSRGISRFNGRTFTSLGLTPSHINNQVSAMVEDGDANVWLASYGGGIIRYDSTGAIARFTTEEGLAHNLAVSLTADTSGGLWVTTFGGGISHFDGRIFTNYTVEEGLASDSVWAAQIDRDRIWFGTYNGLSLYEKGRFTNYTVEDGLASNRVRALLVDDRNHLWVGTDGGLSRFDGRVFQTLLRRDGLIHNDVRALFQDRDGMVWIGTAAGVSRYSYNNTPPPVVITDLITDHRHGPVNTVAMTTTQDFLTFEFTGISFKTRPDAMRYRYRLVGHDDDWSTAYSGRAEYQNLSQGDYTFEVEAIDRDLSYSEQPARVDIAVRRALGRQAMWVLLALAGGLIAWQSALIIRRNRHLRSAHDALAESNATLEVRVEERTAELRSVLGQVALQDKMAALGNLVAGIAHEINNPIGAVKSATDVSSRCIDRIKQALDKRESAVDLHQNKSFLQALKLLGDNNRIAVTGSERIATIVRSLKNFARLDESEFQEADLHEGLDSTLTLIGHELKDRIAIRKNYGPIPPIFCYANELNQVFMNLLINAVQAIETEGEIAITTWADQQRAYIRISDTGKGIHPESLQQIFNPGFTTKGVGVGTGLGLSISYNIVQKHKGHLQVDSEVGAGTTFTLALPMHLSKAD